MLSFIFIPMVSLKYNFYIDNILLHSNVFDSLGASTVTYSFHGWQLGYHNCQCMIADVRIWMLDKDHDTSVRHSITPSSITTVSTQSYFFQVLASS